MHHVPWFQIIAAMIGCIGFIAFTSAAVRWARKGSKRAGIVGWALLLLGAGLVPTPPPQQQIEEVKRDSRLKKTGESGDPE